MSKRRSSQEWFAESLVLLTCQVCFLQGSDQLLTSISIRSDWLCHMAPPAVCTCCLCTAICSASQRTLTVVSSATACHVVTTTVLSWLLYAAEHAQMGIVTVYKGPAMVQSCLHQCRDMENNH